MTATDTSTKQEIPRDRWNRPLIIPEDGGKAVAYTRMSTLAKVLDDTTNLTAWKQRMTAIGLLKSTPLMTRLEGVVAKGDLDGYEAKKALRSICNDAVNEAGGKDKASTGTGLHALTEAVDFGGSLEFVSQRNRALMDAYSGALQGYEPLAGEQFVVVDAIRAAGTFDRLWRTPDGRVVIGDLKTGRWDAKYPMGVCGQLAGYANGAYYDAETGARSPIHSDLDLTTGLLVTLSEASGECLVYEMDLEVGWRVIRASAQAKELRDLKAKSFFITRDIPANV